MNETAEKSGDHTLVKLNETVLQSGDIILVTTRSALSATICLATRGNVSHAMAYVDDYSVIDATSEGVHSRNTQRLFFEQDCPIHVLRPKGGITFEQLEAVRLHLRGHIGTRYSRKEAALTAVGGAKQWTRKQFCSRLVAQAFARAGIKLVPDPNYCSPADLQRSALVIEVPDATLRISNEEATRWAAHQDITQMTRDSINGILEGARAKNQTIETFDDLHMHLAAHPEDNFDMCRILQESIYSSPGSPSTSYAQTFGCNVQGPPGIAAQAGCRHESGADFL